MGQTAKITMRHVAPTPSNVVSLRPDGSSRELSERSDDDLMALARVGRRDAFCTLVARHSARLVQLCAKMTNDCAAAEEIAQDVWVSTWQNRHSYTGGGKFVVFLVTAARNRCRNRARDRARREQVVIPGAEPDGTSTDPSEIDRLIAQEKRERVQAALGLLPEKLREAVVLRFAEELSYEDIASIVGENESTLRSRVHHGIRQLRAELGGEQTKESAK